MSEGSALARLVAEQRWFGSKARAVTGGRIADRGELAPGCALALLEVTFAEGETELYQLPLRGDVLALDDHDLAHALLAALRRAQTIATPAGRIEFALAGRVFADLEGAPVRGVGEQSNSSVVFGEAAILKAYRRLTDGESPELEMLRTLAANGFEQMPRLLGWYRYEGAPLTATLGILQAFVPGARDGWEYALASFAEPEAFHAQLRRLAEVTARMHTALAAERDDPAFRPEPLDGAALARASALASADARAVLGELTANGPAEAVRARSAEALARLAAPAELEAGGQAIRQHGDYHLGQVLRARGDWVVLDFEGEPARPFAERRRKTTPLRDVAGMLRSFAYAAETGRSRGDAGADAWEEAARAAFLDGYHGAIDPALLPGDASARAQLLAACELEKALYELRYELGNRPDWVHVPVAGIVRLLDA